MAKYVLSTNGSVKKETSTGYTDVPLDEYSKFIPLNKEDNFSSSKPVTDSVFDRFPLSENNLLSVDLQNRRRFFVDSSIDLTNKSFNFLKRETDGTIREKEKDEFEKTEYYVPYNQSSDLDINLLSQEIGLQIFADDIDFFGFSSLLKDSTSFVNETKLRLMTILDIFLPALIPIGIIAALELTQDVPDLKRYNLEFGKYVSYRLPYEKKIGFDAVSDIIESNLNVLQRLMNFPKIKRKKGENLIFYFSKFYVYLLLGHISYITPGLKFDIPVKFEDLLTPYFWIDIFTTIINADSPKHIYNLLIKKIGKSAHFFAKTYNNKKGKNFLNTYDGNEEIDTFQKSVAFYGTFFYRYIGERISVGEKQYLIDSSIKSKDKSFYASRRREIGWNKDENSAYLSNFSYGKNIVLKDQKRRIYDNFKTSKDRMKELRKSDEYKQQYEVMINEKLYNSTYMPFTFHDIRTNEIKNFHAYLENVNDSFSPSYVESSGFGRMDPVRTYNGTGRSISIDFWLVSTNKDDCIKMWKDLNWIISMLYPTWSKSEKLENPDLEIINKEFKALNREFSSIDKPFAKIPIATPLIRLRVGNLIVSSFGKKQMELNVYERYDTNNESEEDIEINEGVQLFESRNSSVLAQNDNNIPFDLSSLLFPYHFLKETNDYRDLNNVNKKNNINIAFSNYNYHYNPFAISQLRTGGVGLPGVIKSLNVNIDQNSLWDIEKDVMLPTIIKISMQFEPIHDFKPGLSTFNSGSISKHALQTHRFETYPEINRY